MKAAQGAGRAGDEIIAGRRGAVTGSRRWCWRSRRRLPHKNRHPVLARARGDRVTAGRSPAAADLRTENRDSVCLIRTFVNVASKREKFLRDRNPIENKNGTYSVEFYNGVFGWT